MVIIYNLSYEISCYKNINLLLRLVHKNVGADQSNKMLLKLEEDAEVAYNEYDLAVKAEDRAQTYVSKVS